MVAVALKHAVRASVICCAVHAFFTCMTGT
jgi:hypothetical protein